LRIFAAEKHGRPVFLIFNFDFLILPMKDLYLNIKKHVREWLPEIKHVDLWNNTAFDPWDDGAPFPRPAVFVEFGPVEWTTAGRGKKTGAVAVTLHVVSDCHDLGADDMDMMASLELMERVENAFDGAAMENCTPFLGTASQADHDHGNLIDNRASYAVEYARCIKGNRKKTETKPGMEVSGNLKV